jgi:methyl-accepting chemotaxis protein
MGFVSLDSEKNEDVLVEVTNEEIEVASSDVKVLANELISKATEGLAAIEELKGTMEQIAAAAEESAGASEETLSAITEIKQNSKLLEIEVKESIDVIVQFNTLLNGAIDSFVEASESLKNTSKNADDIYQKSLALLKASSQINDAVDLITKLSKKTGLLALNAAIEAARAGSNGRSFTVMASEIRAMAKKSDGYAAKIRVIVEDIQEKIKTSNYDIENIKNEIEKFANTSLSLADEMKGIGKEIEEIVSFGEDLLNNIKLTVKEIENLHQASETIAAAAEESASAVSEVTNTIAAEVRAFSDTQKAAESLEEFIKAGKTNDLSTASEELSYSISELNNSMREIVEALSQIEEAAEISKSDANSMQEKAKECVGFIQQANSDMEGIYNDLIDIKNRFTLISQTLKEMQTSSLENIHKSKEQKEEINIVKSKIRKLDNVIRKIEISIVQIGALSINGAVEAVRIGEGGEGFSEVSHDIRKLADSSEESLDKVIDIIDEVNEENDKILVEINNIILTLESENNKLKEITNEFENSVERLESVIKRAERLKTSIDEMKVALEQIEVAANQTSDAADIAKNNAKESKEAADIILNISKEMQAIIDKLKKLSLETIKSEQ